MKKELKDIILNSIPKKYHKKLNLNIEKYDTNEETYYFRLTLLIILACIFVMLLVILRVLYGVSL